jgi:splicing factor 3A subunit 1
MSKSSQKEDRASSRFDFSADQKNLVRSRFLTHFFHYITPRLEPVRNTFDKMAPAASLVLPAPRNESERTDFDAGSKAARVESVDEITEQSTSSINRYSTSGGIIYPPPELRSLVDRTARFVAKNGAQFESKIKEDGMGRNKLSFLSEEDPYHAYYRAMIDAIASGQGPLAGTDAASQDPSLGANGMDPNGDDVGKAAAAKKKEEDARPAEPEPFFFLSDMPSITAVDLDILKLTALFTARKGRSFASSLSAREGRSYQFEFLRPSHSLFGYFNRLVEQYRLVMEPSEEAKQKVRYGAFGSTDESAITSEPTLGLGRGGARLKVLEQVQARAEYQKWDKARRRKVEEEEEKEKSAFNEIDWQDFVIAGTVELTETDAHVDLPPPLSLREVENMSMAQKRMAALISEVEGDEEEEAPVLREAINGNNQGDDIEMEMEDESDEEKETTIAVQASNGPMKIRKDYKPKTLAERKAAAASQSTICPVCKTSVPLNQMEEHVKYELLNPHYREQRTELESKKAQHNALLQGADPSRSLKQFAGRRTDIFGSAAEEEAQKRKEEEETRKRKERERMVWDGHAASQVDTTNAFNRPEQLQDEMQHIQKRFKTDQEKTYIGPQIGNAAPEEIVQPEPYVDGNSMSAGAVTYSAPSGPSDPYQAYPGYQYPGQQYVLEKRTDGALYPEDQWMQYHPEPITIIVSLPEAKSISEKCDGSQVSIPLLAPSTTIANIRERIQAETLGGSVGANRLKLRIDGKPTTLRQTLAHWNLVSSDVITLQIS